MRTGIAVARFLYTAGAAGFSRSVADIVAPDFTTARGIKLVLPEGGSAGLRIVDLHVQQRGLHNASLHCASFALSTANMSCHGVSIAQLPGMTLEFD